MKLLHYPPQTGPVDDRVIGIGAHTEFAIISLAIRKSSDCSFGFSVAGR
jgi:hypothetical protein